MPFWCLPVGPSARTFQWTAGDSNPDYLGANQASFLWTSGPCVKRSVRELSPALLPTTEACCRNTYRPSSDPGWSRTTAFLVVIQASSPLDRGIMLQVTEVGVEPTGTRLSTSPLFQFAYPVIIKSRVRGSHPAVQAYEARLGTGPPAVRKG
jgi:hypothetical protein